MRLDFGHEQTDSSFTSAEASQEAATPINVQGEFGFFSACSRRGTLLEAMIVSRTASDRTAYAF